ncbi:M16 peptidase-like protein [Aureococcus anophagefferens]|nr:M16 peptidase-like protein [Aureococcus anophagefferens]
MSLLNGAGVSQDPNESRLWLERAAAQGFDAEYYARNAKYHGLCHGGDDFDSDSDSDSDSDHRVNGHLATATASARRRAEDDDGSGFETEEEGDDDDASDDGDDESDGDDGPGPQRAAAAMVVGVGSWADPPETQGCAHFLEHLLFLGSEKYPDENAYDAFLSKHGGSSNAATDVEETSFHFDCLPRPSRTPDVFAQFFVAPSFNPEAVSREVQAIESEFRETIRDDFSRLDELLYRAPAGHPFGTFTWGNAESLRQGDASAVAAVKALHDAHYHASNMKLAVVRADQGASSVGAVGAELAAVAELGFDYAGEDEADELVEELAKLMLPMYGIPRVAPQRARSAAPGPGARRSKRGVAGFHAALGASKKGRRSCAPVDPAAAAARRLDALRRPRDGAARGAAGAGSFGTEYWAPPVPRRRRPLADGKKKRKPPTGDAPARKLAGDAFPRPRDVDARRRAATASGPRGAARFELPRLEICVRLAAPLPPAADGAAVATHLAMTALCAGCSATPSPRICTATVAHLFYSAVLEEPLYAQLRTKEQLGYTVSCGSKWTDGVVGFAISVTSDDSHPDHVAGRVAAFLKAHRKVVMSLDFIDEFVDQCCSLADRGNEKPRSPSDLADRHWDAIVDAARTSSTPTPSTRSSPRLTPAALRATYDRVFGLGSCAGAAARQLVVRVVAPASFADGRGPAGGSDAFGVGDRAERVDFDVDRERDDRIITMLGEKLVDLG